MAACRVRDSVWFFARSSGGFESEPDAFPLSSNDPKTTHATIAIAGMVVVSPEAMRDVGNLERLLFIPPDARWNLGHTRSSLLQALSCWDRDPFRKWCPFRRQ